MLESRILGRPAHAGPAVADTAALHNFHTEMMHKRVFSRMFVETSSAHGHAPSLVADRSRESRYMLNLVAGHDFPIAGVFLNAYPMQRASFSTTPYRGGATCG